MIVIPRVYGALAGFLVTYGHWPSKLFIESRFLKEHLENASKVSYAPGDQAFLIQLCTRVQLLPRDGAEYDAEDDAGNVYSYGRLGFPPHFPITQAVDLWLSPQCQTEFQQSTESAVGWLTHLHTHFEEHIGDDAEPA